MQSLILPNFGYLALLLSLFIITCLGRSVRNITTDEDALLAFKNHFKSSNILSRNWSSSSSSSSVCEWIGVTCGSHHRRVIALDVSHMNISGTISPQLGNLSFLVSLNISGNYFHGKLPNELSHLQRLKILDFEVNNFNGEIPSWIGSLQKLQSLSLGSNDFSGSIPTSISNLSNLEILRLPFNSLQGSIPKGIGSIGYLKALVIEGNNISGQIPHEIFNISTLEVIALRGNHLSGSLPEWICNRLKKLYYLGLNSNNLDGQIPSNLSQCPELQMLYLRNNQFSGFIPREIGSLKKLEKLYLSDNNIEGQIPREIGNLTMLSELLLKNNIFSGEMPREFGNLYLLRNITLFNNSLSGSIPMEIFNLSFLSILELSLNHFTENLPSPMCGEHSNLELLFLGSNNISGAFPEAISNCSKLKGIQLTDNKFVGSIPNSLGNLQFLEILSIGYNFFTNNLPLSEFGLINFLTNCKYLQELNMDENPLSAYLPETVGNLSTSLKLFSAGGCNINGNIPQGFGNLSSLYYLQLAYNQLTGSIPDIFRGLQQLQGLFVQNNELEKVMFDGICGLQMLDTLSLSNNHILEPIPSCFGNLTSLRRIYLDSNRLISTIPTSLFNLKDLLELDLSTNFLSGFLSPEVGNLKVVTLLDLSTNNFSSDIPNTIGNLHNVVNLSLAFNRFQGSIPKSLGTIESLVFLDLSHNNLSGTIPVTLETLQYLKYFNVSFNDLIGEIPSHGPFQNFTSESFIFNKALCGDQRFHVPPCPKMKNKKRMHVVLFVLPGLAAVLGSIAFIFICIQCIRKGKVIVPSMANLHSIATQERFSYYKLAYATNGFDESNLLGKGSFGSVYRGNIDEQRTVAIKVFNSEVQAVFKSFNKECEVLRNIRHRNLTKVISSCSTPDFKAIIFEFMPNGSLEKWLYSHNYFLNIMQRLNVLVDVATALEYLHNGYMTPVVHCDLKPNNILLDKEMVAHITDFGVSRFLDQEDSIAYTQTIATFGYIAPEYGSEGLVSTKCDVYSYGIMMMEIITRIKPTDEMFGGNFSLRSWVRDSMPDGLFEVLDANVLSANDVNFDEKMECLHAIMKVALNCTKESPNERSKIKDVLAELEKIKLQMLTILRSEVN